ncbi:6-phosphogluconolactonase [Nakamurella flava]|uniref:6-phosphogluconolactonase n=1 Tax=Nakamurella flava TaxID=2576308 RepID=A0A4U6QL69_9ACTN|nr:6-phosphogluconolactonase [Nakamurella flava]TKV60906.1 6-phosphogluconolactonase [Nakamurella flava]
MSDTEIRLHADETELAAATAARLITTLADLQADGRVPVVALTGGGVGTEMLRQVAQSAARGTVDWRRVEIFWGDERFVPGDSDDRNAKGAYEALLDRVDVDPTRVHEMAPSDGDFGDDPDAAAAAYAEIVAGIDAFDIVMLGMGGEGHVASVFPDSPAVHDTRSVVAVRDCPKPPPTRISLTLPTIRTADQVWMIVSGAAKAEAVGRAVGGASEVDVPAAGATGRVRTLWLLDRAAAAELPGEAAS